MSWKIGVLLALASVGVLAQGVNRDVGHCVAGTSVVVACWNDAAGRQMAESIGNSSEGLPTRYAR